MLHRAFAVFLCAIALGGCGGGGGGGGSSAPPAGNPGGPPAPPVIPPVPTGVPVVFFAVSVDNTTSYGGITIEGNAQTILRYVPSTGAVVKTDQNSSFSFANSTLHPFTWGDKLYSIRESNGTARFDVFPVSLQTNQHTNGGYFFPDTFPSGCIAVVGDDLIYRDTASWKKVANLSAAPVTVTPTIMGPAAVSDCTFNLGTANGRLFDVQISESAGAQDLITVREHSTVTGAVVAPNPYKTFNEPVATAANFTGYVFGFDGDFMYMARRMVSPPVGVAGRIEIYRWNYTNIANTIEGPVSLNLGKAIEGPVRMDVRKGFIAMLVYTAPPPFTETRMITYNYATTAAADTLLVDGTYAVQVLFLP
jgi:hypothetical protein